MDFFIDLVIIGLSVGMIYGLVALGISLIYSGLDIVHFAHGEIYMIGAFIGLTLFQKVGLPYVPTLLVAVVLTGLVGVLIERVFYRRLTRAGGGYTVAGMGMVIVSFGMSIVLQNVAFLIWGPKPLPFPVPFGRPIEIGNLSLPMSYLWIVVTALALMLALNLVLKKTMIGLAIRAVAHNKDIAYLSGVNVPRMISVIFGSGCALGAAAGVLIAPINYVQVQMGIGILIKAFAAAVVGGFGSLPGAVLGGLLVGVVESLGAGYVSGTYKDIYAFILLIVVLMVKPSGILGVVAKVKA
ncbi:MAG: branched-chain amino acid transport system permease protein [Alphaproteobacteria bacterium]|nr:branched-chain amino acid transport system permease protein [Alphaproteobacteria bacterium]